MKDLTQASTDRAMRIKLIDIKEDGTNTSGLLFRQWNFDTIVLFGDITTIRIPAFCDELTARYELAQYLQTHI